MQLNKLFHSVRYTRPRQLFHRLRLTARRHRDVRRADDLRAKMLAEPLPEIRLRQPLPSPLLPARTGRLRVRDGMYEITYLNRTHSFEHPVEWHREDLRYGTGLWLLTLHYMEYLEDTPDDAFARLVADWIDHCPPYRPEYWLIDWNSFALSIRCVVWMQQYALRRQRLDDGFSRMLLESLVRQLRFLARNLELDVGGNHLIKNVKALLWAAAFFDIPEAAGWGRLGRQHLARELREQLLADGMHYERSPAYHAQVFVDLVECHACLPDSGLKRTLFERLRQAAQALADTTHPDGYASLFNDGGMQMAYRPRACLEAWEAIGGERPSPRAVFALADAGYFGARAGGDLVLVDCGDIAPDFLPAHGHGDILAFEWSVAGKRAIVDTGTYEYSSGERRARSRATRAHNTVTLDDRDQCEFWAAFRVARRAHPRLLHYEPDGEGFRLLGEHDGYRTMAGSPIHRRRFDVRPHRVEVHDQILGGSGQQAVARLLLHPEAELRQDEGSVVIRIGDAAIKVETEAELNVNRADWYPDFGVKRETIQLELAYGAAPCTGRFSLERV